MQPVTVSVVVDRPQEAVFDFLDALGNHEAFTDHFLKDWELSGPPTGVGAKVKLRAVAMRRSEPVEIEVIDAERPSRITERSVAAGGKRVTRGTYRLAAASDDSTRIEFELAFEQLTTSERLLAPLVRSWARKANGRAMERLRELLHREPASASP